MHRPRIYKKRQPASRRLWRVEEFLQEYLYREKRTKEAMYFGRYHNRRMLPAVVQNCLATLEGDLTEKGRDTTEDEDVMFEWDDTDEFAV